MSQRTRLLVKGTPAWIYMRALILICNHLTIHSYIYGFDYYIPDILDYLCMTNFVRLMVLDSLKNNPFGLSVLLAMLGQLLRICWSGWGVVHKFSNSLLLKNNSYSFSPRTEVRGPIKTVFESQPHVGHSAVQKT